ncbi:hypothetical protein BC826DRAFT_680094 [Russula brevipes]|nr:hypothetical protein BC826DRAFT_680094 [Russula brevipes]
MPRKWVITGHHTVLHRWGAVDQYNHMQCTVIYETKEVPGSDSRIIDIVSYPRSPGTNNMSAFSGPVACEGAEPEYSVGLTASPWAPVRYSVQYPRLVTSLRSGTAPLPLSISFDSASHYRNAWSRKPSFRLFRFGGHYFTSMGSRAVRKLRPQEETDPYKRTM